MSAGLTATAGLMKGVGEYEAGQTRSRLYNANAGIAAQQAQSEEQAGAYNETMVRMRGAAMTGQQVAQIGASGLQQGGTPSQVVASTAAINEMDALQTRNNALRKAWGFRVQEESDQFQAKEVGRAGTSAGFGAILSGGAAAAKEFNASGSWF